MAITHVVGAGLSGLSAAIWLVQAGRRVIVHEAAGQAGGRCRSYLDPVLERLIDNGNHLVLSGNQAVTRYLEAIGNADGLTGPERASFDFVDCASGERWTVRPNAGHIPWWILAAGRRVPGTRVRHYLAALTLARAGPNATVAECLEHTGPAFRRFWEPLAVAVINAEATVGAATLLWPVLVQSFGRGEAACRPRIAREGLSACFVDPAVTRLQQAGSIIGLHRRVRALEFEGDRVRALRFGDGAAIALEPHDGVVLAVPPSAAQELVPGQAVPIGSNAIVNGHFRLPDAAETPVIIGLIGGFSHWLFVRRDIASVTISAADRVVDLPAPDIAARMWPEVCAALGRPLSAMPPTRIVKERRATFAQTPANLGRRPAARTSWRNLILAGDWTDTGLPATIEGSVASGERAAAAILADTSMS
ncbi:MAG: amine oxidase [Rhodospirillales bacterium]|nr:MAG: amine oxidase [Rhodospirillales bacterium]